MDAGGGLWVAALAKLRDAVVRNSMAGGGGIVMRLFPGMARDRRGAALVEFTLLAPILLGLALTGFEMGRLLLAHQKVSHAAGVVADLVAQSEAAPTQGDLRVLMGSARPSPRLRPGGRGTGDVTSFTQGGNQPPASTGGAPTRRRPPERIADARPPNCPIPPAAEHVVTPRSFTATRHRLYAARFDGTVYQAP
jgi:hypothetical protein